MMNPSLYLAGPISGLSYDQSEDWRIEAKKALRILGIDAYSPLRRKEFLKAEDTIEGYYQIDPLATARGIITRDHNDVKERDALLVNLLGATRVSIGTIMEIAFGYVYRKPTVVICEDDNIHWKHPFVVECTGYKVNTLEEGIDVVASILLP